MPKRPTFVENQGQEEEDPKLKKLKILDYTSL